MAVKVTKPKVNIRQKLTELDIPKGAHGTQLVASRSAAETFNIVRADRKNLLYNGEMQINQRGNVTGVTGNQYGGPDRWKAMIASAGTWSISQDSDVPSGQGFARSLKHDCTTNRASLAAGSGLSIAQYLEGYDVAHLAWGNPEAKDLTLSFWLKVDNGVSGTFVVLVRNHGSGKLLNRQVRVNREGGWNHYVVNIPADKAGAFSYGNTNQLEIKFTFEAGSNAGGGASGGSMLHQWLAFHNAHTGVGCDLRLANSTSNNLWLTGVQLEAGNEPTTYDHRSYGEELALCQRYFWREYGGVYHYEPGPTNGAGVLGQGQHPVAMRAKPTMSHNCSGSSNGASVNGNNTVGVWTWYKQNSGFDSGHSSYQTVANWNFANSEKGIHWNGGSYNFRPSDESGTTGINLGVNSYIQADAEL